MKIKKYLDFIMESSGYEFGCVMIEVPVPNWNEVISAIDPEDVYEEPGDTTHGIEDEPHLTVLYGLHKEVTEEQIKSIIDQFENSIKIEIDGVGIFENEKFDVVKFNVRPDTSLQELHNRLSELPNSDRYPEYNPHITISYVKKGRGKKYINPDYKHTVKNSDKITYSHPSGKKTHFTLK